jgi:hypothetical protein
MAANSVTAEAITAGDRLFVLANNSAVTKTDSGSLLCVGQATADALLGDATVRVLFNQAFTAIASATGDITNASFVSGVGLTARIGGVSTQQTVVASGSVTLNQRYNLILTHASSVSTAYLNNVNQGLTFPAPTAGTIDRFSIGTTMSGGSAAHRVYRWAFGTGTLTSDERGRLNTWLGA